MNMFLNAIQCHLVVPPPKKKKHTMFTLSSPLKRIPVDIFLISKKWKY